MTRQISTHVSHSSTFFLCSSALLLLLALLCITSVSGACSVAHGVVAGTLCRCATGYVDVDCARPVDKTVCNSDNRLCMAWTYDATNVYYQMESKAGLGLWFAWMWGDGGGMFDSDAWIFQPLAGISEATTTNVIDTTKTDYFSDGQAVPTLDAQQDLKDMVAFVRGTSIIVTFRRQRLTGDSADKDILDGARQTAWAIGTKTTVQQSSQHTGSNRGRQDNDVNFIYQIQIGAPSFFNPPTLSAGQTNVTVKFTPPTVQGITAQTQYTLFVLPSTQLSYINSTAFRNLNLTAQQTYVTSKQSQSPLSIAATATTQMIVGLTSGTCYTLLLSATNGAGAGPFSAPVSVCTTKPNELAPPKAIVTQIVLTSAKSGNNEPGVIGSTTALLAASGTSFTLSFDAYATAVKTVLTATNTLVAYKVDIAYGGTDFVNAYSGLSTSNVQITGLLEGTVYSVRLSAVDTVGASPASDAVLIQTAAPLPCLPSCDGHGTCVKGRCVCNLGRVGETCMAATSSVVLSENPYFTMDYTVIATNNTVAAEMDYPASRRLLASSSNGTVYVQIEVPNDHGWSGLILGGDVQDGMSGGDAWLFLYDGTDVTAYDRYASSQSTPAQDTQQDLKNVFASEVNGRLRIRFQRALITGDAADKDIINGLLPVSYAVGTTSAGTVINQHDASQRGKLQLNFFTNQVVSVPDIKITYFVPFPIIIAIFCVFAVMIRKITPVRQSHFFRTIMHRPFLNSVLCCCRSAPSSKGFRSTWFDTLTLDARQTISEWSTGEVMFILSYLLALLISIGLAQTAFDDGARAFWYFWGDVTAIHLALGLLPVSRTSFFLYFCGISFERAVKWHRYVQRITFLTVLIHCIQMFQKFDSDVILTSPKETEHGQGNIYGFVAALFIWTMSLLAFEPIRRAAFSFFYITHMLFVVPVYVLACLHSKTCFYLCIIPICLYALDRLLRFWRSTRTTKVIGVEVIEFEQSDAAHGSSIIHLQLKQSGFNFKPGQYAFVNIPSVSLVAWHPFSLSSSNALSGVFSLHILAHRKGLTGMKSLTSSYRFGPGSSLRTGPNAVGVGLIQASGCAKNAEGGAAGVPASSQDSSNGGTNVSPANWTQGLLVTAVRYLGQCGSVASPAVSAGNSSYRDPDALPVPPMTVRIDGPYGSLGLNLREDYHTLILCAGGIGATPVFSMLHELVAQCALPSYANPIEVVHFIWVCNDAHMFQTMHPGLWQNLRMNPKFRLHFYATRKHLSSGEISSVDIVSGRPDWRALFQSIVSGDAANARLPSSNIGEATGLDGVSVEMTHFNGLAQSSEDDTLGGASPSAPPLPSHPPAYPAPPTEAGSSPPPIPSRPTNGAASPSLPSIAPASPHSNGNGAASAGFRAPRAPDLAVGVFVCGPSPLVSDVEEQASYHGMDFHKEVFKL